MYSGVAFLHIFDYSFLENSLLPAKLIDVVGNIYALSALSCDGCRKFEDIYTGLSAITKVQAVKCSNHCTQLSSNHISINARIVCQYNVNVIAV